MRALVCQGLSSRGKVTAFPSHWEYVSLLYECYLFFSDLLLTPHEIPGPGVTENGEMPCRCWERSLSPLEKQLLPTDPSLQPFGLPLEGEKDKTLLTWGLSCSTPTCLSEHRDCSHVPPRPGWTRFWGFELVPSPLLVGAFPTEPSPQLSSVVCHGAPFPRLLFDLPLS